MWLTAALSSGRLLSQEGVVRFAQVGGMDRDGCAGSEGPAGEEPLLCGALSRHSNRRRVWRVWGVSGRMPR